MKYAWTVVEHTGEQITLVREGELLQIPLPDVPVLRKYFMEIRIDQLITDGMLRLLSGRK